MEEGYMRIGHGYDVHRLVEGRKLILGGVEIPYEKGLDGHSDADVLLHAVMDALLGAAALRDIGVLFPDNDERYRGIDSMLLLAEVMERLAQKKLRVGKTTTTINLAASLATLEKKVLVIDADPQANASSGLGVDLKEVECSIYECLINQTDIREAIYTTDIDGLDIIPSHIDLVGAEIEMLNLESRENIMKRLLAPMKNEYDYILIDCSPSLGLITINALTAADSVIIPVQCEYFALEGISKLLNTIKIIKSKLNTGLEIEGFLLTMFDSRLRLANQIYDEVKRHFQELVFQTIINRNVKLSEAPSHGMPAILYDADSTGAKNHLALGRYR